MKRKKQTKKKKDHLSFSPFQISDSNIRDCVIENGIWCIIGEKK